MEQTIVEQDLFLSHKNDLSFTSGTLHMRFQAVAAQSGDGTGTATISFTNNGVTNSDVDITLNFT